MSECRYYERHHLRRQCPDGHVSKYSCLYGGGRLDNGEVAGCYKRMSLHYKIAESLSRIFRRNGGTKEGVRSQL